MNIKRLVRVKDNRRNGFVGAQVFTYDELKRAFDKLEDIVYGDRESEFEYYFEINGSYNTKTKRDFFWHFDFDYNRQHPTEEPRQKDPDISDEEYAERSGKDF